MSLDKLQQKLVWKYFLEMTKIPRPSKNEKAIREHLKAFAKDKGFKCKEDQTGNLLIEVPASKGLEKSPVIVFQGHMDMVAEANSDSKVDPTKDPLDVYIDGDLVKAKGTTLGADNGIGLACAMAIATDTDAKHGPIEILCTVDEETALVGAAGLKGDFFKGRKMINLDAEDFGMFFVGCAGGEDTIVRFPVKHSEGPKGYECHSIKVSGLKGGHSGIDIIKNKANANKLLALVLKELSRNVDYKFAGFSGGNMRNAIPREGEAHILLKKEDISKVEKIVSDKKAFFVKEYKGIEDNISLNFSSCSKYSGKCLDNEQRDKVINLILSIPSGVIVMSRDIPNFVETSTNLGVVKSSENEIEVVSCKRTSVPESMVTLRETIHAAAQNVGAKTEETAAYPGWMPNMNSELLKAAKATFEDKFKKSPEIVAIHAGLECGLIGEKYEGIDMISMGPDIKNPHSPDEYVSISSTDKFYDYLKFYVEKLA